MAVLLRHGQSTWNLGSRLQGQTAHPPLTPQGRVQALAAGERLAGCGAAYVVASDLVRAQQTALIVATALRLEVRTDARLREWGVGELEGLSTADAARRAGAWDWTDPDCAIGGGESSRQVRARMSAAIEAHPSALLVSHGDAIRVALEWWSGLAPATGPWVDVDACAAFVLDEPGHWTRLVSAAPARPA